MKTREEYLMHIRRFKEDFAAKYGILKMGILGSVARGEHGSNRPATIAKRIAQLIIKKDRRRWNLRIKKKLLISWNK